MFQGIGVCRIGHGGFVFMLSSLILIERKKEKKDTLIKREKLLVQPFQPFQFLARKCVYCLSLHSRVPEKPK